MGAAAITVGPIFADFRIVITSLLFLHPVDEGGNFVKLEYSDGKTDLFASYRRGITLNGTTRKALHSFSLLSRTF